MGGRLMAWSVEPPAELPALTGLEQTVLTTICRISDDTHGRFWMHPDDFLTIKAVSIIRTRSSLRDHIAALARKGYIERMRTGNGKTPKLGTTWSGSDGKRKWQNRVTEYQVLAFGVISATAIADYEEDKADMARRRVEKHGRIQRRLPTAETLDVGKSDIQKPDRQDARVSALSDRQDARVSALSDRQDARVSALSDRQDARVSALSDRQDAAPYYMNTKGDKNTEDDVNPHHDHADDDDGSLILFSDRFLKAFIERANRAFDLEHLPYCAAACTYHSPIIASDFSYLGGGTATPSMSAADQIIAGTLAANPRYLLRYLKVSLENLLAQSDQHLIERVEPTLPTYRQAPPPMPPELASMERPAEEPCRHETTVDPAARDIWTEALGHLRQQVARPAYETWLADTIGVSRGDGEFVVGTANAFVSEMLEHRMYPLIERAITEVIADPTTVQFSVLRWCSQCVGASAESA